MSAFNPTATARTLQQLCRHGVITPHDLAVGMALLWSCRQPGAEACMVGFKRLAKLAGVGRTTAVEAVGKLRALGVLVREKTRLRVRWGLGIASRQGRNIYRWAALATEAAGRATDQMQGRKKEAFEQVEAAQAALARVGKAREAALAQAWANKSGATRAGM